MKIIRTWMDPDTRTVGYVRYLPGWTWADHHQSVSGLLDGTGEVVKPTQPPPFTYTIVDWRGTQMPLSGSISAQYRKLPENVLVVIVLTDSFAYRMIDIGLKIRRDNQFRTCRSLEDAEKLINHHRSERGLEPLDLVNWVNQQQMVEMA